MRESHFAIVDIETTGSYAAANQITEIAIFIFDGKKIIDEYVTLINPMSPIPFHIQTLTGITDEMVQDAPTFKDVAENIYQMLRGRIFVAHNVHFDYSFILAGLKNEGYDWKAQRLCTVRLARKIFPGFPSYSLGKICQSLGIPLSDRHRAFGDAKATVELFRQIYERDEEQYIAKAVSAKAKEQRLPTHIPSELFESLPSSTGIYIFRNSSSKIIYVGKAVNIKKRVISHFTGNNQGERRQKFINEIADIEYQESGTELMALMMECNLIKKHWPIYNRALKKYEPKFGLLSYEDQNGYLRLSICQIRKGVCPVYYFNTVHESTQFLMNLIDTYQLDYRLCSFFDNGKQPKERVEPVLKENLPELESYNQRMNNALNHLDQFKRSFLIVDKGRNREEKSYVYFKDNKVHAVGFVANDMEISHIEDVIVQENLVHSNYYMNNLADSYALRYPNLVLTI